MCYKRPSWSKFCLSVIYLRVYLWLILGLIKHLLRFLWMFLVSLHSSYSVLTTIKYITSQNQCHQSRESLLTACHSDLSHLISVTWKPASFCASVIVSNIKYLKSEIAAIHHYNRLVQRSWITWMIDCSSVLNSVCPLVWLW